MANKSELVHTFFIDARFRVFERHVPSDENLRCFGRVTWVEDEDKRFTTSPDRIRRDRPPASTVPLSG